MVRIKSVLQAAIDWSERRGHCTIDDNHHAVAYIDVYIEDVTNSDGVQYARTIRPYNSPQCYTSRRGDIHTCVQRANCTEET